MSKKNTTSIIIKKFKNSEYMKILQNNTIQDVIGVYIKILSNVYENHSDWEGKVAIDFGCGSVATSDSRFFKNNLIWHPWMCRILSLLPLKEVIGIDLAENKNEKFKSISLDMLDFFKKNKCYLMFAGVKFDLIVNKDFTGIDDNIYSISPGLFYGIKKRYSDGLKKMTDSEIIFFVEKIRDSLFDFAVRKLKNNGIYVISSGNRADFYIKKMGKLILLKKVIF